MNAWFGILVEQLGPAAASALVAAFDGDAPALLGLHRILRAKALLGVYG